MLRSFSDAGDSASLQHGGEVDVHSRVGAGQSGRQAAAPWAASTANSAVDEVGDKSRLLAALSKRERAEEVRRRQGIDGEGNGPSSESETAIPTEYLLYVVSVDSMNTC